MHNTEWQCITLSQSCCIETLAAFTLWIVHPESRHVHCIFYALHLNSVLLLWWKWWKSTFSLTCPLSLSLMYRAVVHAIPSPLSLVWPIRRPNCRTPQLSLWRPCLRPTCRLALIAWTASARACRSPVLPARINCALQVTHTPHTSILTVYMLIDFCSLLSSLNLKCVFCMLTHAYTNMITHLSTSSWAPHCVPQPPG